RRPGPARAGRPGLERSAHVSGRRSRRPDRPVENRCPERSLTPMRSSSRLFRAALVGLLAAGLSGCGLFSQTDARFDPAPLTDYTPSLAVSARWSASIGSGGGYGFSPELVG